MNTIAKIIVSTTLGLAALGAQAGQDNYPGDFAKASGKPAVAVDDSQQPYVFQGEFLIDNPKYVSTSRSVAEVRAEIPRQRVVSVLTVGA